MRSMVDRLADPAANRRWLLKALREASGELYALLGQALREGSPGAEGLVARAWREQTIGAWQLGHLLLFF